jgi:hypothetical protein
VVKQIICDTAVFASLPENIKADIAGEVRRLQMMMDRYWLTQWLATRRLPSFGASSALTYAC